MYCACNKRNKKYFPTYWVRNTFTSLRMYYSKHVQYVHIYNMWVLCNVYTCIICVVLCNMYTCIICVILCNMYTCIICVAWPAKGWPTILHYTVSKKTVHVEFCILLNHSNKLSSFWGLIFGLINDIFWYYRYMKIYM